MPHRNNDNWFKKLWTAYYNSFHAKTATFIIIVCALLIWAYFYFPTHHKALSFITTIIVAGSGVFSAIYVGKGLSNRIHFDKINNSFQFTGYFNSHEYNRLKEVCTQKYHHHDHSRDDLLQKVKADEELLSKLKSILNKFEELSIAIQNGYVDEEVCYWTLDIILQFYTANFMAYIEEVRAIDDEVYMELMDLYNHWSNNKFLYTGNDIK